MIQYVPPVVLCMGRVEELTGQLRHGVPDLLGHGNIL